MALSSAAALASFAMWGCRAKKKEEKTPQETEKMDVEEPVVLFYKHFLRFALNIFNL